MKRRSLLELVALLTLGACGCGELSNQPFLSGIVRGRLTEYEPALAQVAVEGRPELNTPVAEDGSFVLGGVPPGPVELLVLATQERALRLRVRVLPGESSVVGEVQPRAAASLELKVKAPNRQRVKVGSVSVLGTPLLGLALKDEGLLEVGPLPEGCYTLQVSVPRFAAQEVLACVNEGEHDELEVRLPEPLVRYGCTSNEQCERGNECNALGQCVAQGCTQPSDCPPGLVCHSGLCSPPPTP